MNTRALIVTYFAKGLILVLGTMLYVSLAGASRNLEMKIVGVGCIGALMLFAATAWKWNRLKAEMRLGN